MQYKFIIPSWGDYQHYSKRNPPWIKLHYQMLSSETWVTLDDASRALAIACMLIASRHEGKIPADDEYVKRVAYLNRKPNYSPLISCGFIVPLADASAMLADASVSVSVSPSVSEKGGVGGKVKISLEELSVDHNAEWLAEKRSQGRYLHHDEHFILEQFKQYCQSKGKKYADYRAGYQNAFEWERCQPKSNGTGGKPTKDDRARAAIMRGLGFEGQSGRAKGTSG